MRLCFFYARSRVRFSFSYFSLSLAFTWLAYRIVSGGEVTGNLPLASVVLREVTSLQCIIQHCCLNKNTIQKKAARVYESFASVELSVACFVCMTDRERSKFPPRCFARLSVKNTTRITHEARACSCQAVWFRSNMYHEGFFNRHCPPFSFISNTYRGFSPSLRALFISTKSRTNTIMYFEVGDTYSARLSFTPPSLLCIFFCPFLWTYVRFS